MTNAQGDWSGTPFTRKLGVTDNMRFMKSRNAQP